MDFDCAWSEYVLRQLVFRILTIVSARMLRTKLRVRGKATAVGHRFLLLSPLLRQMSLMHNERRDPVLTHQ